MSSTVPSISKSTASYFIINTSFLSFSIIAKFEFHVKLYFKW
ncbi:hypothetical protein EVA_12055 [gut metagenome]|uniref:Uncharacterized protein n=1 Tax=gut metagenome TaxID=749906 RepID=J9FZ27_9ZZZZ